MTTTTNAGDGKEDKTDRNWMQVAHFLALSAWERVSYVSKIYRNAMPKIFCVLLLAFGLGVWLNYYWEFKEGNVILMLLTMALWAFLTFHPKALVPVLTFGALKGLPNTEIEKIFKNFDLPDFELNKVLGSAGKEFKGYVRITARAALFWTATFAVLALFQLENGWAAYAALAFLAGTGLWTIVYDVPAGMYRFMTGAILTFGLLTSVIAGYRITHPQDKTTARLERVLMENGDRKINDEVEPLLAKAERGEILTYEENEKVGAALAEREGRNIKGTVEDVLCDTASLGNCAAHKVVSITSFAPQLICNLEPGERKVTIPYQQIALNGGDYGLSDAVMLNGAPVETSKYKGASGAVIRVNPGGCVRLSFNYTAAIRQLPIQPQQLNMTFE